jgi:hypothetical protein
MKNTAEKTAVLNDGSNWYHLSSSSSLQKRGHRFLNSGATASALDSEKVTGMEWFSVYFTCCKEIKVCKCVTNYTGYIGGVEAESRPSPLIFI